MSKEIKRRLFSIIYIIVLVSFSTWFIFGPREKLVYAAMNVNNSIVTNNDIIINSDDTLNYNKDTYNFSVVNKKGQEVNYNILLINDYRKSILKDCKVLSNNYLKYRIKDNQNYSINRNVRSNGIIYTSTIKPYETKNFSIELWLDKEENDLDCYYPMLKIEEK